MVPFASTKLMHFLTNLKPRSFSSTEGKKDIHITYNKHSSLSLYAFLSRLMHTIYGVVIHGIAQACKYQNL